MKFSLGSGCISEYLWGFPSPIFNISVGQEIYRKHIVRFGWPLLRERRGRTRSIILIFFWNQSYQNFWLLCPSSHCITSLLYLLIVSESSRDSTDFPAAFPRPVVFSDLSWVWRRRLRSCFRLQRKGRNGLAVLAPSSPVKFYIV